MLNLKYFENIKKDIFLTEEQKEILIGTILGDATFVLSSAAQRKKSELILVSSIKFEQSSIHKDCLFDLFLKFKDISKQKEPKEYTRVDKRYLKKNISYSFSLQKNEIFRSFANIFLKKNDNMDGTYIKIIPENFSELLTPRALAYWICDDGQSFKRGGVSLCTDNYSLSEVLFVKNILENKYKLQCTIHNRQNKKRDDKHLINNSFFKPKIYYRIYISGKSLSLLNSIVGEFIHPTMKYKIKKVTHIIGEQNSNIL